MKLEPEQRDWLALSMTPGVGTAVFIRLLARYGAPGAVLRAPERELSEAVGPKLARRIAEYAAAADVERQERLMDEYGARLLTLEDPEYPVRLAEIYDPPLALFVRGELREEDERCVAIVGTRRATPYGLRMAERLARELARENVTVVSGMAAGIDAAAHSGAMDAGGRTIAVLGNGVDRVYPRENGELMHRIMKQGCVASQFAMGVGPSKGHFPYRNRIISGMCLGVIIIEAPLQSGALITARQASEQGREVFAVPGQVGSNTSAGPHRLIQEGAKLITCAEDVLVELELPPLEEPVALPEDEAASFEPDTEPETAPAQPAPPAPPRPRQTPKASAPQRAPQSSDARPAEGLQPEERRILNALDVNGSYVDEIAMACRISVSEALSALTLLELKGVVRQFSGKRFAPR